MCVVGHCYGVFGGAGMMVVDGMHAGQSQGGLSHFPSVRRYTGDTRSHRCPGAQLWVGLSRNLSVFMERP